MTIVVLLFLAVIWGVVLFGYLRERLAEGTGDSIGSFHRQLSVLERTGPVPGTRGPQPLAEGSVLLAPPLPVRTAVPVRRVDAQKRRRDILGGLLVAMLSSLALGFLPSLRVLWSVHVVLDVLFAAYVTLLVRRRNLTTERNAKLHFLPGTSAEPALLLRRTGN